MATQQIGINPNWPATQVEMVPIADLIPYIRNPRQHSPAQVLQIAASLKEFGWTMPVLRGQDNGIIAGHGRIQAAHKLHADLSDPNREQWALAPVTTAVGWPESKRRAYVIADNKLALNSDWNVDLLATEIEALREVDFDIDLLGFSEADLARLSDDLASQAFSRADTAVVQNGGSQLNGQHPGDMVALTIPMSPAQRAAVFEAIEKAKTMFSIVQSGEALCRIASQFLDSLQ
jgi:ParB-like nuclease domain